MCDFADLVPIVDFIDIIVWMFLFWQ